MNEFNPLETTGVIVTFKCDQCDTKIKSEELDIPMPDYSAETASDSHDFSIEQIFCPNKQCQKDFQITINSSFYGGSVVVSDIPDDDVEIWLAEDPREKQYYEDYYGTFAENDKIYLSFLESMENLEKLNQLELPDIPMQNLLKRQLYTSMIATLEAFLSETFIKLTLREQKYLKAFITTYPEFKERKFELKKIFETYENIEETAKLIMLDIIYHNLPKVKPMFESTFDIEFPDISELIKMVQIRHDLVHRNGKTKEGVIHEFTSQTITDGVEIISGFVKQLIDSMLFKPIDVNDKELMDHLDTIFGNK